MCLRDLVIALGLAALAAPFAAAADGPLFPTPFLIEHQLLQIDPDGAVLAAPPVVDHYGGSWIVTVRPDGGRTVLDLARHELTTIDPAGGVYSVLSFGRFGELAARLRRAEGVAPDLKSGAAGAAADDPVELRVARLAADAASLTGTRPPDRAAAALLRQPQVVHLRVTAVGDAAADGGATLDAWVDSRIRLSAGALTALEDLEAALAGGPTSANTASFAALLAAARREAGGALVLRTVRPAVLGGDPAVVGLVEDVTLRLEIGVPLPPDLVAMPEGLERVPHVLESAAAWAEDEADLRRRMTDVSE